MEQQGSLLPFSPRTKGIAKIKKKRGCTKVSIACYKFTKLQIKSKKIRQNQDTIG